MPTVWFVFLCQHCLKIISYVGEKLICEKGGRRRAGVYWQRNCLSENSGSNILPVIVTRKWKSIQSRAKSDAARLPLHFSVNSQTFHLWCLTWSSSCLDAAWVLWAHPWVKADGCQDLGLSRGQKGSEKAGERSTFHSTDSHEFLYRRTIVIYKLRTLC